jgi:hypothetical protein
VGWSAGPAGTLFFTLGTLPLKPPPPNIMAFWFQFTGRPTWNRILGAVASTGKIRPATSQ